MTLCHGSAHAFEAGDLVVPRVDLTGTREKPSDMGAWRHERVWMADNPWRAGNVVDWKLSRGRYGRYWLDGLGFVYAVHPSADWVRSQPAGFFDLLCDSRALKPDSSEDYRATCALVLGVWIDEEP